METKANYTLIGTFVITFVASIFVFIFWISGMDFRDEKELYIVNFSGSVGGLRIGESVRFHGIPIGAVKSFHISPHDPEIIQVKVTIRNPDLIRTDSVATIEAQGLTGYTYIQIEGGSSYRPVLKALPGARYPVIPSKNSRIEEIFRSAPQIVDRIGELTTRLNRVLRDENIQNITRFLDNLSTISDEITKGPDSIKNFMGETRESLKIFRTTLENLNGQIHPLGKELIQTMQTIRQSGETLGRTARELEIILAENRPELKEFMSNGMDSATNLMQDTRMLIMRMNKIMQELERGPAQYLNKTSQQGYKPE